MKPNERLTGMIKMGYASVLGLLLSSCTVYQNIPDDDGIYSTPRQNSRVIVVERNAVDDSVVNRNTNVRSRAIIKSSSDAFTREIERLDRVNNTDILTDIEYYTSQDTIIVDENGNARKPSWGDNNDNVVVNINMAPNFGWGVWDPWMWNNWGWNNWGWNTWGPNWGFGWNNWGVNWGFGWAPAWGIGSWGWNNSFYRNRFWYGNWNGFYNGYNQVRYGRRVAYNSLNRNGRRGFDLRGFNARNRRGPVNFRSDNRSRNSSFRNFNNNDRRRTINNSRRQSDRGSIRRNSNSRRSSINRGSSRRSSGGFSRGSNRSSNRGTNRGGSRGGRRG